MKRRLIHPDQTDERRLVESIVDFEAGIVVLVFRTVFSVIYSDYDGRLNPAGEEEWSWLRNSFSPAVREKLVAYGILPRKLHEEQLRVEEESARRAAEREAEVSAEVENFIQERWRKLAEAGDQHHDAAVQFSFDILRE